MGWTAGAAGSVLGSRAGRRLARLAGVGVLTAASFTAPGAAAEEGPHFLDAAGDANFLNDQGLASYTDLDVPPSGPDTRPAAIPSADVLDVTFRTAYETLADADTVSHVPVALLVDIRTSEPAAPAFGPTVAVAVPAEVNGCNVLFRMYVHGPASDPADPPQAAELRTRQAHCLEGPMTYTDGVTLTFDGRTATLRYDFAAFMRGSQRLLGTGMTIGPDSDGRRLQVAPARRMADGALVGGPLIDTAEMAEPFVIGSDVPPNTAH